MFSIKMYRKYLPYAFCILSCLFSVGTYLILTSQNTPTKSDFLFGFLYIDILLLFCLIYIVAKQIARVVRFHKKQRIEGGKFHKQIILLFSVVTVIPAMSVFLFAVLFFNMGVESLFKAPIKGIIDNANQVAEVYIKETRNALENYVYGVGMQLKGVMDDFMVSKTHIDEILNNETSGLGIDAIVFESVTENEKIVIAQSPFSMSIQAESMPHEVWGLNEGEVMSWETEKQAIAVNVLDKNGRIYLMVAKDIDSRILNHKHKIKDAVHEYTSLANQRTGLKITFMTFFSSIIILLLAIVILTGVLFANRITKPVGKLIYAAKNISAGNYETAIVAPKINNEFDILISSFNIMASKLEAQRKELAISNRQNAWRDIARKIAHEIKNPLTPIQLSAERLKRKYNNEILKDREVFVTCIDTIIRQVHCIGSLVKEFSDFARMPTPKLENADIIQLIKETVFLQSSSYKNIEFHIELNGYRTCCCYIDPAQMNQVLMNILQNSINAIIENNTRGNIYINLTKRANSIIIFIEDDGPGFSQHALLHGFDPYYTTREAGSGLGLAIVYKIIIEHGGQIELNNSNKFGGASVKIVLPVIE